MGVRSRIVMDSELGLIEQRCRLKAEGARWAMRRRQRLEGGADYQLEIRPLDRQLIEKAQRLSDCFLWLNHPDGPAPGDLTTLEELAGCFEAAAEAVALVRSLLAASDPQDEDLTDAMALLAEGQSALRVSVSLTGHTVEDNDQYLLHRWLRQTCSDRQIYLRRYLRLDDPGDPAAWPDLSARVSALDAKVQAARQRAKKYQAGLGRVRYHIKSIVEKRSEPERDWKIVALTIDEMVASGTQPSNVELRELLLPVIWQAPRDGVPMGFRRVVDEIQRFLETRPNDQEPTAALEPSAEIRAVEAWLAGTTVVLIGGDPRPEPKRALEEAFRLGELDWVPTREHQSISIFESHISRPEVAVVLLAIRWASHSFGEIREFCVRYGKPLVRLPGGYNPNQVAAQILAQCGASARAAMEPSMN